MLDSFLDEALARLDRHLVAVCHAEERRARALAGTGGAGWDAVRALAGPEASSLAFAAAESPASLVPDGRHPFGRLRAALGLEPVEIDALLVLLSPHLEPRYRSIFAVLQDDLGEPWVTERLLLTVLGTRPSARSILMDSLSPAGRLVDTGLVEASAGPQAPLMCRFDLAAEVRRALMGLPPPRAVDSATWIPAPTSNAVEQDAGGAGSSAAAPPLAVIHGAGERRGLARALAARAAEDLVFARLTGSAQAAVASARSAWRLGLLYGAITALDLGELDDEVATETAARVHGLAQRYGGRLWLLARTEIPVAVPHHEAPAPTYAERVEAWRSEGAQRGVDLDESAVGRLAAAYRLGPSGIRDVFESVQSADPDRLGREAARLSQVTVRHALRVATHRTFDDLVLRDTTRQALERLVYYVQHRDRLGENEELDHRYRLRFGPIALFTGRPGTGKTLAAEVIAGELGRPLYVVDLSRLVSKYIGETEKHIDQVLDEGERAAAVLFFDEADALFSARTEVSTSNDRFANLEVGYLLQRIERHDGLVILATNLRQSIDEAFLRRFQLRVEFPLPEPGERERIWELMLPPSVGRGKDVDLHQLAARHRLAGGDIRNAALKAIFLAEQRGETVAQSHLDEAVAIELLELGRLSRREDLPSGVDGEQASPADRGRILRRLSDRLQEAVETYLRPRFLKEIHIVHGAPTKEALAGKRPAVSLALYRMAAEGSDPALHLGFIVSTWSHRPEEEHELLGVVMDALEREPLTDLDGAPVSTRVQQSYDFDLLHRFWSSHGQPVRASLVVDVEVG